MDTVELLEHAIAAAKRLGVRVRIEALDVEGGPCEFGGRKWLFLDVAKPPIEHLHQVLEVLRAAPDVQRLSLAPELRQLLTTRRAA